MKTFIANIKHAVRNGEAVSIGGGTFNADELKAFVADLAEIHVFLTHVKELSDADMNDISLDVLDGILGKFEV